MGEKRGDLVAASRHKGLTSWVSYVILYEYRATLRAEELTMGARTLTDLQGKIFEKVTREGNSIEFRLAAPDKGRKVRGYSLHHEQECCESVWLEDVVGDLADLENETLEVAEEVAGEIVPGTFETMVWTFYKFRTTKGSVTVRFCAEDNTYYSIAVELHPMYDVAG